jgi:hypothetical protein
MRTTLLIFGILIGLVLLLTGCAATDTAPSDAQTPVVAEAAAPSEPADETVVETVPPPAEESAAEPNESKPTVELMLRFAAGQATTYKVTTEVQKSVEWEGSTKGKPAGFTGGRTGSRVEMTFDQEIESVNAEGDAIARITIKTLKYLGRSRNQVVFDFDSTRPENPDGSLASLIGRSYKLEMSARGAVLAVVDIEPLRQAVREGSDDPNTALKLLVTGSIRERHEIPALLALKDARVRPGQSWSRVKAFSFGRMGAKSYERVYTLQEVQPGDGGVAVVEMKAIPSAAMAEEIHKQQTANPLSAMFDNTESYEGRLELKLGTATIRQCVEEMRTEWVVADPAAIEGDIEPAALRMTALQLHRIELVE